MIIYFRADANSIIATGHIMRCCAVASEFIKAGHEIKFILADKNPVSIIKDYGFSYHIMNTKWDDMESEIDILSNYIIFNPCNLLFVDSYYVSTKYFKQLKQFTKIAYLDDLCLESYNVDYVINYSIYANDMPYNDIYPAKTIKLLGSKYIPLRSNFYNISSHRINKKIENILLLTGGSDNYHIGLNFIKAAISAPLKAKLNIVCGTFNSDFDELKDFEKSHDSITIYSNVNHIEQLMCDADIAISAGGSTTYELAVCGTPTITYSLADNQFGNVHKWASLGLMDYSGDVRNNYSYENLICMINKLATNYNKREKNSALLQGGIVNPYGAKELVKLLCS